jgi:outer membrane protein OmpA-like peptidoglycan-associated protein
MEPNTESSSAEPSSTESAMAIETVAAMPDKLVFEAARPRRQAISLKGNVPAAAAAAYFGTVAGDVPTENLSVVADLPKDFVTSALTGIDALGKLSEGRVGFDGSRWWLRGKGAKEANAAVTGEIAALPKGADWSVSIDNLATIDICRDKVDALADRNAILFQAGKPALTDDSMPIIDELATDLAICPDTLVHVEGHTDADGDEDSNLAISVARAEAVVAELIKRGVAEERLYAEGYGESAPLVDNDTKDNKARNRRIAFTITPE